MNRFTLHLLTGACGLFAGVLLSGGVKDWGKTLAMGGLMAVPSIYVTHLIVDTQANNRLKPLQKKLTDTSTALERSQSQLTNIEAANRQLTTDLEKVRHLLQVCEKSRTQFESVVTNLTPQLTQLQQELTASKQRVIDLETEVDEWEENFHAYVETEADKQFKVARANEIQRIFDEHDSITSEAMQLFRELQAWGQKIAHGHTAKREIITNLATAYNQNLDELGESVEKERGHYLEQIELLHEKVGRLQHQLAGDLLEPEYGQFGYSIEGKIANDIARRIWEELQIPLAVKGYQVKPDGSTDVGYSYSRSISVEALVSDLNRHSSHLAKSLGIHKISSVRKLEIADLLVLTFRREPTLKQDTVKLIAGSPEQFLEYVATHPIRYRLIADPGRGKTPVTGVMVSKILEVGGTRGNTGKGRKIPNTLVTVSCPDVESSQKDDDYPLEVFLKYGDTTAAVKSFSDADEDWKYRKRDTNYAQNFFQLWIWDELDNTLNNADDPLATGTKFKNFLKQAHHTGVGWIVSGQSVMTSQIKGFMDDDRELFTQIIIGTSKIRKYLEKYGKKILSSKVVAQLLNNLDELEPYIEDKNSLVTDAARLLRLALVLDDKSPKLYFLPNLDSAKFDAEKIEETKQKAELAKRSFLAGTAGTGLVSNSSNPSSVSIDLEMTVPSNQPIGGSGQSSQKPHCCHCGEGNLSLLNDGRYRCLECKKRFVSSKAVWR